MDEDAPFAMRWPRVCARVAGYAILAVVLYVLSCAPAFYLLEWRWAPVDQALDAIYWPVRWLRTRTPLLESLVPYNQWWLSLPDGPIDRWRGQQSTPLPASQLPIQPESLPQ